MTGRSPGERAAAGRAARARTPRRSHAEWAPAPGRPDPVALLEAQERTRVPELVPIRHGRMLASPFAFYRGAAAIMAADLAADAAVRPAGRSCAATRTCRTSAASPRPTATSSSTSTTSTRRCPGRGSGTSSASPRASRSPARDRGFRRGSARARSLGDASRAYREAMRALRRACATSTSGTRGSTSTRLARARWRRAPRRGAAQARSTATVAKARRKDSLRALAKLDARGRRRAAHRQRPAADRADRGALADGPTARGPRGRDPRAAARLPRERCRPTAATCSSATAYVDLARKVVGVGSVGTRAWIVLLLGPRRRRPAVPPGQGGRSRRCSSRTPARAEYANQGQRVVEGQRLMQAASDILLGWLRVDGRDGARRDYYVRQLWDWKASADRRDDAPPRHARLRASCAAGRSPAPTPARATAIAIARLPRRRRRASTARSRDFAERYADQNERDHAALAAVVPARAPRATA